MIDRSQIVYHRGGLVFGLRGTEIVHIDDVANGLECGCLCEECHAPLVARNRGLVRMPHFAHASGQACHNTGESGLVRATTAILNEIRTLLVPPIRAGKHMAPGRLVQIDAATAVIERGQRPEVLVLARDRKLRLCIRPSLRISSEFEAAVRETGISAMQLAVPTDETGAITAGIVADALVSAAYERWWLFNSRIAPPPPSAPPPAPPPEIQPVASSSFAEVELAVAEPLAPTPYHPAAPLNREPGPRFCWRCEGIRDFRQSDGSLRCSACKTEFLGA